MDFKYMADSFELQSSAITSALLIFAELEMNKFLGAFLYTLVLLM